LRHRHRRRVLAGWEGEMIVLEGCDCAGKSVLAMELAEKMIERARLSRFERYGLLPEWWDYEWMYVRSCERWAIVDRFVVSEFVYGRLWRGGPNEKLTCERLTRVKNAMKAVGALTVHVAPPYEVVEKRLRMRGDDLVKRDDLATVMSWYDEYLARANCAITDTPVVRASGIDRGHDIATIMTRYLKIQREVEARIKAERRNN